MSIQKLKGLIFLLVLSSGWNLQAARISDRLETQKFFTDNYKYLYSQSAVKNHEAFSEAMRSKGSDSVKRSQYLVDQLGRFFVDQNLMGLAYHRILSPNSQGVKAHLMASILNKAVIIRDMIDHPVRYSSSEKAKAAAFYESLFGVPYNSESIYSDVTGKWSKLVEKISEQSRDDLFVNLIKSEKIFSLDITENLKLDQPYALSWVGFIPGNKVEVISENEVTLERINWVNERVMYNGGVLNWSAPYLQMPNADGSVGHPVWNDPIFKRIREMVDASRQSIFIDIFLFGGTMGATLAKHLLDHVVQQKKVNPQFKVLIMHDYATNYTLGKEMLPVFEYIKSRIQSDPGIGQSVILLQANIQRHPPGIPLGITNFIPKTPDVHKVIEKMDTYYESKIDHSKVIVIDAESDRPQAYFGSKNWSDHSGSYYYDDAIYVEGPGAAAVQALYYDDVEAALTEDPKEMAWFYFKDKGLDNKSYLPRKKEILTWFKVKRKEFPSVGGQSIRYAEANVDGKIKNARNILIDMIRFAQKNIYMEQLFIYDKYVNEALMKRKKQVPGLKIRILADHNGNFGLGGFPNTIFIKELLDSGIEIKARRTYGIPFTFPNGIKKEFHQENHRKITSVDGKILLGGSSNLNPDTLQGSFREFGAQIYDTRVIGKFEDNFLQAWDDNERTMPVEIDDFRIKIGKKLFSPRLSSIVNSAAATIVRSKDQLEGREND